MPALLHSMHTRCITRACSRVLLPGCKGFSTGSEKWWCHVQRSCADLQHARLLCFKVGRVALTAAHPVLPCTTHGLTYILICPPARHTTCDVPSHISTRGGQLLHGKQPQPTTSCSVVRLGQQYIVQATGHLAGVIWISALWEIVGCYGQKSTTMPFRFSGNVGQHFNDPLSKLLPAAQAQPVCRWLLV